MRTFLLFGLVACLILVTGFLQSWNSALLILNMGLVSAVMALGVNLQWGLAGLFNVGVMGFVALGGLAVVLVSMPPVGAAWQAGGGQILLGLVLGAMSVVGAVLAWSRVRGKARGWVTVGVFVVGIVVARMVLDPAVDRVEDVDPALAG